MTFDEIYKICAPFTIRSKEKMEKLYQAVIQINKNNIEGDFVECGVYKGGSVMNMVLTQLNYKKRADIYLYDTFEGMTAETEYDVNYEGTPAQKILRRESKKCIASLEEVKRNVNITHYPEELLHYVKGDVAKTLLENVPERIALLRLDTDWYESTKIELEILYPKLVKGGILILDDYGYWKGARKASDDYFASIGIKPDFATMQKGISGVMFTK